MLENWWKINEKKRLGKTQTFIKKGGVYTGKKTTLSCRCHWWWQFEKISLFPLKLYCSWIMSYPHGLSIWTFRQFFLLWKKCMVQNSPCLNLKTWSRFCLASLISSMCYLYLYFVAWGNQDKCCNYQCFCQKIIM